MLRRGLKYCPLREKPLKCKQTSKWTGQTKDESLFYNTVLWWCKGDFITIVKHDYAWILIKLRYFYPITKFHQSDSITFFNTFCPITAFVISRHEMQCLWKSNTISIGKIVTHFKSAGLPVISCRIEKKTKSSHRNPPTIVDADFICTLTMANRKEFASSFPKFTAIAYCHCVSTYLFERNIRSVKQDYK